MNCSVRAAAGLLLCAAVSVSVPDLAKAQQVPSVRRVQVLGKQNPVEIEIEGSDRLIPQARVLTHPDRLVVDFANAVPGAQLRNQNLNRGEVKSVRTGLFSSKPPVTRVVFDLNGPQQYQLFPAGRTVIIKLGSAGAQGQGQGQGAHLVTSSPSGAKLVTSSYTVQSVQITPPDIPPLVVSFERGLLTVNSNKASLSEVLFAIHQRTGADIAIPAGAEQEKVVAEIGPASAPEVLSRLLNGSKFNFLILSSASDPATLDRVILSARPEGPAPAYRPQAQTQAQTQPEEDAESEASGKVAPPPAPAPAAPNLGTSQAPAGAPETKPPAENESPD
ncbi:MAG: AMIN domain-containing protein [Candidatus Sulfotelmatobacter sp.]